MTRTLRRFAALALAAGAALLLTACAVSVSGDSGTATGGSVSTNVDDFTFASFDADYTLTRAEDDTSRLTVVETIVAVFPDYDQNHGIRRSIPDTYNGQPLEPRLVSVTDADGTPRPAETDTTDGQFVITSRADQYLHGAQTFVVTYTLENVTWHFPNTNDDEFYWDVNGTDWPQPFGAVTARLHVPADLAPALTGQHACYQGAQGATTTCEIAAGPQPDGGVAVSAKAADLGPHETMTIAVGFAPGTFATFDASPFRSVWGWLALAGALGAIAVLVWAIVLRVTRLRDAPGLRFIVPEYDPPAQVDALLAAVLLRRQTKAVPAEILEQAVAGSIRIVEDGRTWGGKPKLRAELVDPSRADTDGALLLTGLFGDAPIAGASFDFSRDATKLPATARQLQRWAARELRDRGLVRSVPGWVRGLPILAALAAGILVVACGIAALSAGVFVPFPMALMVLAVVVFFVVASIVPHRPLSPLGAEVRDRLHGLRVFIDWAEADRIRMLQSPQGAERRRVDAADPAQVLHLYEELLPYAVVFGQEKRWSEELAARYGEGVSPSWYVGAAVFDPSAFSSGIGSLSSSISASSSGGAGGGGSAGGGGGGGGGGGV
ncbi:DUF2207 domain-containing protein [Microbacterium sp. X-17]|uniref:DUF2207 domain-containing protein n=1 Tax=Microbacterium sp. X-17 TaxID=3144404 RepID=UPI0031F4A7AF